MKTKISSGFAVLALILFITGGTGLYGIQTLKSSLQYITGNAWDTADGAMEGTIGIEAEMLGIAQTIQRQNPQEPVSQLVSEGQELANEALGRMEKAGMIDAKRVEEIHKLRSDFAGARTALLQRHQDYLEKLVVLENNFHQFQLLMEKAEEIGDGAVEALRNNPDTMISWNDGLSNKWIAADGAMESNIGLLKRIYYFERLTSGKDYDESVTGLAESAAFLKESLDGLIEHPVFKSGNYTSASGESRSFSDSFRISIATHSTDFDATVKAYMAYAQANKSYQKAADNLLSAIEEIEELGDSTVEGEVGNIEAQSNRMSMLMWVALIAGGVLAFLSAWKIVSNVTRPIAYAVGIASEISRGKLDNEIMIESSDEAGQLLSTLSDMQNRLSETIQRERHESQKNSRIKQALDNVSANVMVADADNNIIYINDAGLDLFTSVESEIATDIAGFKAADLVGSSIDRFHKNPDHQRNLLANLQGSHKAEFVVGGRTMGFTASPVIDDANNRLGAVVEWNDRTDEVATQRDIESLIIGAQSGDLSRRIDLSNKQGFFLDLSKAMNQLIDTVSGVFDEVASVMAAMSNGDLDRKITGDHSGTFAEVQHNVNSTIDSIRDIVSSIRNTTDQITSASEEISTGNNSLSERTERQAASLEETASSMEELTSTVRQNADNANSANQLADSARETATGGGKIVSNAIHAMKEINVASDKIAEIISVIDNIAFQTNLLALNASVEAARAGEQGRGFAVVATEVRNLAQRSATSAREIKDLIQDSVDKVEAGSKLVNESGEALENIVSSVIKVGDIVAEIAAASLSQASGIDEINQTVTNLDDLTQQNAALAEETSAASISMNEQARMMSAHVEFFKVGSDRPASNKSELSAKVVKTPMISKPAPKMAVVDNDNEDWEEF